MADQRISQLNELAQAALAANDLLPIVDSSSSETKKITAKSLFQGAAGLADNGAIDLAKLNQASTTKLGVAALGVTGTDKIIGRFSAGAGAAEEITLTAAGRQLLDDVDVSAQRTTLGLGTLATQSGTVSGTHSGNSSGTNTGDQTIALTGAVTGTGNGTFAATITDGAVTTAKIPDSAITTAKIADGAITAAKIGNSSTTVIAAVSPNINGVFVGQQWFNTDTGLAYGWDGAVWTQQAGVQSFVFTDTTPLTFSAAISSVGVATISSGLETQTAATVLSGPTTGSAAAPTFRTLISTDLPNATASVNGVVQPGEGLAVTAGGVLNHTNTATPGTYTKVLVDAQGHVSTGTILNAADIPALEASKITSGTFAANLFGTNSITGEKLANSSTVKFGGSNSTSGFVQFPAADFQGQLFWDELNGDLYIWNGSAWLSVTVTSGELVFTGIYNASTNVMTAVSAAGAGLGLNVGSVLPAPSGTNLQYYVVVGTTGTGVAPAPTVALQPPDFLISTGSAWTLVDVSTTVAAANNATGIEFTPAGDIVATNVQTAIQELDTEKLSKTGGTVTGNLEIGAAGSLTFEGSSADANELTIAVVNPTADRTITFPNATGTVVLSGTIVNADVNASAAIVDTKLATIATAGKVSNSATTAVSAVGPNTIVLRNASNNFSAGTITANLTGTASAATTAAACTGNAATVTTNANLTGDVTSVGNATSIAAGVIINADINASAAIVDTKLAQITTAGKVTNSATTATNANTASAIVARNASGDFSAGTITAALIGNASTVTTNANLTGDITSTGNATSIAAGVIVNADINASAAIVDTKLATIATAGKVANSATTAVSANTASAIVVRDATGNFSAGTITANITGTASGNPLLVRDTAIASTSGTSINFTGIPSYAKRITVMFSEVSTNGTSGVSIQLGDSGGIETTGYNSSQGNVANNFTNASIRTTGFVVSGDTVGTFRTGLLTLVNMLGNVWVASGRFHVVATGISPNNPHIGFTQGSKELSGVLDRIRITTITGADAFDNGFVNILYEG